MKYELTLPPIDTRGEFGALTLDENFKWEKPATAQWDDPSTATITTDGFSYSLPLAKGPVISSGDMDRFLVWLEMKSAINAFSYELKLAERSIKYGDAIGAIEELWKITECDDYLLDNCPTVTHAYFKHKLVNFSLADAFAAQKYLPPEEALAQASASGYSTRYEKVTPELSGGTFTPVKAFAHYLWGNGESLRVDINNIGLNIEASDIPSLVDAIVSNHEAGRYRLGDDDVVYDTSNSNRATGTYLGRITLKIGGIFTRHQDATWAFEAVISAGPKKFDSSAADRAPVLEILTSAGRLFSGQTYDIEITGEHRIHLTGSAAN